MSLGVVALRRIRPCIPRPFKALPNSRTSCCRGYYNPATSSYQTYGDGHEHVVDLAEEELVKTLQQYEQSALKEFQRSQQHDIIPGSDDDRYPLGRLSKMIPHNRHEDLESVFIRPFARYPTRSETSRSSQRNRADMYAFYYGQERHYLADWESAFSFLAAKTPPPAHWHSRAIAIVLDSSQRDMLRSPHPGNSNWEIGRRTGCYVEFSDRIVKSGFRADILSKLGREEGCLIISGEEVALRRCMDELTALLGSIRALKLPSDDNAISPPPVEQFPTEMLRKVRGYYGRRLISTTVDRLQEPHEWTAWSLERHIGLLISCVPDTVAMKMYGEQQSEHQSMVVEELMRLLHNANSPVPVETLAPPAYKLALSYMAQKGTIFTKQLWLLFSYMRRTEVPLDAEVFNILLESCAKSRHLRQFNKTLILMTRMGFHPDLISWQMFLRFIKSPILKRQVVHEIRSRGLIRHPRDKGNIAQEMVQYDLEHYIRSHNYLVEFDLNGFIAQQDAEYGDRSWLSLNTFKRIAETLGRFGLFTYGHRTLVHLAKDCEYGQLGVDTFNTILTHIRALAHKRKSPNIARPAYQTVAAMLQVRRDSRDATAEKVGRGHFAAPDAKTYEHLFIIGHKLRMPNFMAVAWRYAVLHGRTTSRMRQTVLKDLIFGRGIKLAREMMPVPVMFRTYVRRLFMDDIMRGVLSGADMEALEKRQREEYRSAIGLLDGGIRWEELELGPKEEEWEEGPEEVTAGMTPQPQLERQEESARPGFSMTEPLEFSLSGLSESQQWVAGKVEYGKWHMLGLRAAVAYKTVLASWEPKWGLDRALKQALERDLMFRSALTEWEKLWSALRRSPFKRKRSPRPRAWLLRWKYGMPAPIRIPIYNRKAGMVPYKYRWFSFGGDPEKMVGVVNDVTKEMVRVEGLVRGEAAMEAREGDGRPVGRRTRWRRKVVLRGEARRNRARGLQRGPVVVR